MDRSRLSSEDAVYHDMKLTLIKDAVKSLGKLASLMRITELKQVDDGFSGEALELILS